MAGAHLVGGNVPESLVTRPQLDLRYNSHPNAVELPGCNMWHSISVFGLGSQRPVSSDQVIKGVGAKTQDSPLVHERERGHHPSSDVDSGLPHSGSSCFSDISDSTSCCVTSDSEQEVRTSGRCRRPVEFFVGLGSDSDEDDEFFKCSDLSDDNSESNILSEEEDDDDVTFSDDLCCSFEARLPLCRSQSWCAPEGISRSFHMRCIPQSLSESNVTDLVEPTGNRAQNLQTAESKARKRVHFQDNPEIHCIVAWNFAYRAARIGPWKTMATTRDRFKKRVEELEQIFYEVFSKEHRGRVLAMRNLLGTGDSI